MVGTDDEHCGRCGECEDCGPDVLSVSGIPEDEGDPESEPWTVTGSQRSDPGGSIIILNVEDPHGEPHVIGVDARTAFPILDAFYAGDVVLIAPPEPWQIIG